LVNVWAYFFRFGKKKKTAARIKKEAEKCRNLTAHIYLEGAGGRKGSG
jgi:hypothetical protein